MKRLVTWFSAFSLFAIFAVAGAPSGFAGATAPTQIYDYETIFGRLDADGGLRSVRLVNQLRVFGEGDVVITDQAPTQDFRNLTGKGSPSAGDDTVEWSIRGLSGSEELVSSGTPDVDPPLSMQVTYYRNGEQLPGPDAVGKSGTFDVTFDVSNLTAESTATTITNGAGKTELVTQMVPLPMVAELTLVLPQGRFTRVDAPGADVLTDPNGNLVVRWAMVMVPPIGDLTQSFNLRVDSGDFQIDAVRLQGVPVAPQDRPSLAFTQGELSSSMESAGGLYSGTTGLSSSVDELHGGVGELVSGLGRLLRGMRQLAAGLGEAHSGSGRLTAGLGDATVGSGKITAGLADLVAGLKELRAGLRKLGAGLPAAKAGADDIAAGGAAIQAAADAAIGPLNTIILACIAGGVPACLPAPPLPDPGPAFVAYVTVACTLTGGAGAIAPLPCPPGGGVSGGGGAIADGAAKLSAGIADAIAGVGLLTAGAGKAVRGGEALHAGSATLTSGLKEATDGAGELTAGLARALSGADQLAEGTDEARSGGRQIEQGVYLVNEVGVKEISRSANTAVSDLDRQLQLMEAQNERAANFTFYGPPSADQADVVVGGAGVVLTMDALSNRGADTTTRGIGILIVLVVLLALWLIARAMRGSPAEV